MNIWYIHPNAGGPEIGRHWRPYWLAHYWREMGHNACVITPSFHHIMYGNGFAAGLRQVENVPYHFLPSTKYTGNRWGRLRHMFAMGSQLQRSSSTITSQLGKPDVIYASSPHLFYLPSAMRLANQYGAQFWLEVRDLWPMSLVELKQAHRLHPIVLLASHIERRAYQRADKLLSLLSNAESYMLGRGLREGRFVWVPNGISPQDLEQIRQHDANAEQHAIVQHVHKLRSEGKFVVAYTGALGPPNAMEYVVDAAALLQQRRSRVHFLIVGTGVSKAALQEHARHAGASNLEFFEEVTRAVAHRVLSASDAAVISFHDTPLYNYGVSPNKLFDYLLLAKVAFVCASQECLGDLATEKGFVLCPPANSVALADALHNYSSDEPSVEQENLTSDSTLTRYLYGNLARLTIGDATQ
jgi:glycosyltransferase involved in cell wall biosynthesis